MKTTMIKRAALAVAILAGAGVAHGVESALQVVYCKATIMGSGGGDVVSVTIPPTDGYFDQESNPLTFWNVGNVPAGGVADSWHQEGGPGRFTARNAGNVGAYFYVTTGGNYRKFIGTNTMGDYHYLPNISNEMFGMPDFDLHYPSISPIELRTWTSRGAEDSRYAYHLAFTTDTSAKVPTWHSLDHRRADDGWHTTEEEFPVDGEAIGYMGYVVAGDYLTFDLKFWAPSKYYGTAYDDEGASGYGWHDVKGSCLFTFCVEASSFPLWDHGRAVE